MTVKHTPGPWIVQRDGGENYSHYGMIEVVAPRMRCVGFQIATGVTPDQGEVTLADAKLIAAAPELLEVAKAVEFVIGQMSDVALAIGFEGRSDWDKIVGAVDIFGLQDKARAAIAKAEGKP